MLEQAKQQVNLSSSTNPLRNQSTSPAPPRSLPSKTTLQHFAACLTLLRGFTPSGLKAYMLGNCIPIEFLLAHTCKPSSVPCQPFCLLRVLPPSVQFTLDSWQLWISFHWYASQSIHTARRHTNECRPPASTQAHTIALELGPVALRDLFAMRNAQSRRSN